MTQTPLPELTRTRSAPVPNYPNIRADESGRLWRWSGEQWERFGTAPGLMVTLRNSSGKKVGTKKARLVASAWHGARPAGWSVIFSDGNNKNLTPSNLGWSKTKTGYPRRLNDYAQRIIRRRAAAGAKLTALAREYGVNIATICSICKNYVRGGPSVAARRWLTPDERREIFRLSESGLKQAAIARRFRRSVKRVQDIIREECERAAQVNP